METLTAKPTRKEQEQAKQLILIMDEMFHVQAKSLSDLKMQLSNKSVSMVIPVAATRLLKGMLSIMAEGKTVTLIPSDSELSTQQAADILKVSRPHLVKLLEGGKIPFRTVGRHRRIRLQDINVYEKQLRKTRREQLEFITRQAQELNLGYE